MLNDNEILKQLIGKTEDEGKKICTQNKYKFSVNRTDEINNLITLDCWLTRICVEIDNGVITKCSVG